MSQRIRCKRFHKIWQRNPRLSDTSRIFLGILISPPLSVISLWSNTFSGIVFVHLMSQYRPAGFVLFSNGQIPDPVLNGQIHPKADRQISGRSSAFFRRLPHRQFSCLAVYVSVVDEKKRKRLPGHKYNSNDDVSSLALHQFISTANDFQFIF